MDTATRVQILDQANCISHSTNTLGKGMNQIILPLDMGKWYLMPLWFTLSIIRYGSRVKWSNPVKGRASSPTPLCCSEWKGSFNVSLDYSSQLYFLLPLWVRVELGVMAMKEYYTLQISRNSLNMRFSLVPYSGHPFLARRWLISLQGIQSAYIKPCD